MTTVDERNLHVLAKAWAAADPDDQTRAETETLLRGDPAELERRFGERLEFGTAGLRGALGAGPSRMNRVLVRVVAAALGTHIGSNPAAHVVVGYDARHKSRDFAEDTARVLAAHGIRCTLFGRPIPTPALAFAVRHLDASAGVMVTASHNPRADNGYKVYWRGGAQIVPPVDSQISDLIASTPLLGDDDLTTLDHDLISVADDALLEQYVTAAVGVLDPDGSRSAIVAYTPLHGVGAELLMTAFERAGFSAPAVVPDQAEPDPDFPTTPFPNPEETGVLDRLLLLGSEVGADVALANDPDADRLSVAVPNGVSWTLLSGDEVGTLLAEYLLSRTESAQAPAMVANTVVSSRLLADIARHHGAHYEETLTGFKWIMDARQAHADHRFVLGYEEALGYAVTDQVRDKDGISAALVIAEMVSGLADEGRTLLDLRDDLHRRHGVHVTGQRSIRFEATDDTPAMATAMASLRVQPPSMVAGHPVRSITDLAEGGGGLPPTDGVVLDLDIGRLVVRPSGTEPKMKVYAEVAKPAGSDVVASRATARIELTALLDDAVAMVAAPERAQVDTSGPGESDSDIELRATRLAAEQPVDGAARAQDLRLIVRCIDLTTLEGDDTPGRIRALCAQARRPDPADPTVGPTAAVCVYPALVSIARELTGGGVQVASVAGAFPSALSSLDVRIADIQRAVSDGADEVDIVMNRSAFLSGRSDLVADELSASIGACGDAHCKVILEVGELRSPDRIRSAARLALEAGADVIKTSTGKSKVSATPASVLVMAETIAAHAKATGQRAGIKIAGGVRTADDALGYVAIVRSVLGDDWLTPERLRFGASSLLTDVLGDLAATEGRLRQPH